MRKYIIHFLVLIIFMLSITGCQKNTLPVPEYPLSKETVETALKETDLSCVVSNAVMDHESRTSISLRDEEERLIAGIASEKDGDKRFLGFSLIGYAMKGEASVFLLEDQWDDMIKLGVYLYGGSMDPDRVYNDFIKNYEKDSIITEYEPAANSYLKAYEWVKQYGDLYCSIIAKETTDGVKEISNLKFYNHPSISNTNSELKAIGVLNTLFTGSAEISYDISSMEDIYIKNYGNFYSNECLETLKNTGIFTVTKLAALEAGANIMIKDIHLELENTASKYNAEPKTYTYCVTMEYRSNTGTKDVTAKGTIKTEHMINGWKITDLTLVEKDF